MNRAIIIGNLTKDPEAKATANGTSVSSFTVAVERRFSNQSGERGADFIPVVAWRGLADTCNGYLHKGSKVAVSGSIQTRSYEAKDGTKRYVTEIMAEEVQFLNGKGVERREEPEEDIPAGFTEIEDEDLPF